MVFLSLFRWWYGSGWKTAYFHASRRIMNAYRLFSVPILLRTLFAPWRRIITTPGPGLQGILRAVIDNTVSRIVGSIVRFIVLISAGVVITFASIISVVEIVFWPIVPPVLLILIGLGIIG